MLWIVSLTMMGVRLAGNMVRFYGDQVPGALPVTTLTQNLAQLAVVVLGILLLLSALGLPNHADPDRLGGRRPGGGAGAAGYAIEPVRRILCSGGAAGPAGRLYQAEYGEEGYVTDIGWRSTTIRALGQQLHHRSECQAGAGHRDQLLSAREADERQSCRYR